jgi:hypothetical protein
MVAWEKVEVPRGTFIGWGNKPGQHVTGRVLEYDPVGGTDYAGEVCPLLEVELTERAASFDKALHRTNFDPGELVSVTCGQKQLKRAIKKADLAPGDMVKIELEALEEAANGQVKIFEVHYARGAGKKAKGDRVRVVKDEPHDLDDDDEPPF